MKQTSSRRMTVFGTAMLMVLFVLLTACGGGSAPAPTAQQPAENSGQTGQTSQPPAQSEAGKKEIDFPTRSMSIVIGYPPGGTTEPTARVLAKFFEEKFGKTVTMDSLPGSLQAIAAGHVLDQEADGHTLFLRPQADYISGWMLNSAKRQDKPEDFIPIGGTAENPYLFVVHGDAPWNSMEEFVAEAKKRPGELTWSSSGINSLHHIIGTIFENEAGIDLNHIPYNGGGPATEALIKGDVDLHFSSIGKVQDYIAAGRAKVLAVLDTKRMDQLPDVPTASEAGFELYATVWHDLVVEKGTPDEIVEQLREAFKEIVAKPEVHETFEKINYKPVYYSPEEVLKKWEQETKSIEDVIADLE